MGKNKMERAGYGRNRNASRQARILLDVTPKGRGIVVRVAEWPMGQRALAQSCLWISS